MRYSPPELWICDETVPERLGCPNPRCGERHMDRLEIMEWDNDAIRCHTCGVLYRLPWPREESCNSALSVDG